MFDWLTRALRPSTALTAVEGQYRPGPYLLSDGWLPAGSAWNFWQQGYNPRPYGECSAIVESCISAYAQTVAACPGDHWRQLDNGGRERVANSAASRILRRPNDYQSISDFLLNLTRRLYSGGEAFALAIRNDRSEIAELHLMRQGAPRIAEDGSVFYSLAGNEIIEQRFDLSLPVPARDVLHVRLQTPRHPLKGESPLLAAALDIAMSGGALNQQIAFYLNQAKPSFVLEMDGQITHEQAMALRESWHAQTQGANAGGTPILTWGLKAKPVTATAEQFQLAEMLKMTDVRIAAVFRVPLAIVNLTEGGGAQGSTEAQMQFWISTGLGFCLNHIEVAFDRLFGLRGLPLEYTELDTSVLLRSNFKDRMEGYSRGVLSGVYSSDEARAEFGLPATPGGFGAEPRVQQQVVPLSAWEKVGTEAEPATPAPDAPPPAAEEAAGEEDEADDDQRGYSPDEIFQRLDAHRLH